MASISLMYVLCLCLRIYIVAIKNTRGMPICQENLIILSCLNLLKREKGKCNIKVTFSFLNSYWINWSIALITPLFSLVSVTMSAIAFTSSLAFPIATASPAYSNISMSLAASPIAAISLG